MDTLSEEDKSTNYVNDNGNAFVNSVVIAAAVEINAQIKNGTIFDEEALEFKILKVSKLINKEKLLKRQIKKEEAELHNLTKTTIENLKDEEVIDLLEKKWIEPLVLSIADLPNTIIQTLTDKIKQLSKKYDNTLTGLENEINESEKELSNLIDELTGNDYDMQGLKEFQQLLRGVFC